MGCGAALFLFDSDSGVSPPPPPGAVPEMQMYPQMFWRDVNFDLMTHTFLGTKKLEFHHMSILRCGGDLGRVTQDRAYHVRGFPKILSLL